MITIAHVDSPESLVLIHGIFEHTNYINSTIIIYYEIDDNKHQDVYIGDIWHNIIPKVIPLFELVINGIDVIIVNAGLVDLTIIEPEDNNPKVI